ncbi:hypothetical protein CDAR_379451 [Caerostris darwini]|uniref:Uncharacterized protein n=1 Tax=Caerostris darwini TaxID=1538125 RepID=A0AAV4VBD3_9ARAC|nr:hypothetical protein CDAR_379451 [Caerostris darwini]
MNHHDNLTSGQNFRKVIEKKKGWSSPPFRGVRHLGRAFSMAVRSRNGSAEMKGERGKWRALIIFYVRIKAILQSGRRIGDVHKNKSRSPTFDGGAAAAAANIFFVFFPPRRGRMEMTPKRQG